MLEVPAHRTLRRGRLSTADRPQDLAMLAEDRVCVDSVADRLDEARLEDVERPAREGAQQLVSGG